MSRYLIDQLTTRANVGVLFRTEVVAANGETTFTITYEALRSSQAWFRATLSADALGDKPLVTEKSVGITGGAR